MSIGSTIKRLRREREITQEQLAEYLGISASAVSQWECDKSCPDITQLPILANIFDVTTDEILSVNIRNNEERIKAISKAAKDKNDLGKRDEAEIILADGLREFPNSYKLMEQISTLLYCKAFRCGNDKEKLFARSLEFAQKVIAECSDIEIKSEAIRTASYIYNKTGRKADAEKCAKMLPEIDRNDILFEIYTGVELEKLYKKDLIQLQIDDGLMFAGMLAKLHGEDGEELYTDDEKLIIYQKIIDVYKILYEDEDYDYFSQFLSLTNDDIARIYAKAKNGELAVAYLADAAKYAIMFATYDWEHIKTSLLFRGLCDGGWVKDSEDESVSFVVTQLYDSLNDEIYDFVREDDGFKAVCATLCDFIGNKG